MHLKEKNCIAWSICELEIRESRLLGFSETTELQERETSVLVRSQLRKHLSAMPSRLNVFKVQKPDAKYETDFRIPFTAS